MKIFYFSGTGNSLHIARELQKRVDNTSLHPIISLLNEVNEEEIHITGEKIGIVFPIFAFTTPQIVEQFLMRARFENATYIFSIASRICSARVFSKIDRLLHKQNQKLSAGFYVETPENYIPVFKAPLKEEIDELEEKLHPKLDDIAIKIQENKEYGEKDPILLYPFAYLLFPFVTMLHRKTRFFNMQHKFYTDANCTGCGICEKVCLAEVIKIVDNKPTWQEDVECIYCYACIHWCPSQAIQKGKKTATYGRYHHPAINYKDIAAQKKSITD